MREGQPQDTKEREMEGKKGEESFLVKKEKQPDKLRSHFFRWLLKVSQRYFPSLFARVEIQILLSATARAFHRRGKFTLFLPRAKALRTYADFTQECMKSGGSREELYRAAFALGQGIRAITGFRREEELRDLVFFLYRGIGIAMDGSLPGDIRVSACFFSRFYSPAQCHFMSGMDAGVITGLFGGGDLVFTERITEGCPCCLARLRLTDL